MASSLPGTPSIPREALLNVREVMQMTKLSRSEIYRRMNAGTFPIPFQLGKQSVAWSAGEVYDWIASRPRVTLRKAVAVRKTENAARRLT